MKLPEKILATMFNSSVLASTNTALGVHSLMTKDYGLAALSFTASAAIVGISVHADIVGNKTNPFSRHLSGPKNES